ncbi:MAG: cellulase family glycosylhydrolase [Mucilaginibacter sp.]
MTVLRPMLLCLCFMLCFAGFTAKGPQITVKDGRFFCKGKPYYYIGANYWYGSLLAIQSDPAAGKARLIKELDFLKSRGVNNLRVLVGSEGAGKINGVDRVTPVLQPEKGVFNDDILNGLDFFLFEMGKRQMYAVLYLSNNWEWSGGFLQYLNWNGQLDLAAMQPKMTWDAQRDFTSKFYTCEPCMQDYKKQVDHIFKHVSKYTNKTYAAEPAIMAWELANEPRPMRSEAVPAYKAWTASTASYIKSLDKNHLVTLGTEGIMGTEESAELFTEVNAHAQVDYLTLHVWPKNWGWFADTSIVKDLPSVISKTNDYIEKHVAIANQLNKPLVIEEFGLPRDGHSFDVAQSTKMRDSYYTSVFDMLLKSRKDEGKIAGANFWAFGGTARPVKGQLFWKYGDQFMGDPPQEEQGLNTVFDSDSSTWQIIKKYTTLLK